MCNVSDVAAIAMPATHGAFLLSNKYFLAKAPIKPAKIQPIVQAT